VYQQLPDSIFGAKPLGDPKKDAISK